MEIEENHRSHKRSRVGKGNQATAKLDDDEEDGDQSKELTISNNNNGNPMRPWHHPSSRIFRVSRASGGKDRHSKVYTAKGLRDRRVRLSVSTAIQFYDLQDRLGYDQPSKAIEWLIKAAESAISELPSLDTTFPEPPLELQQQQKQLNIEKAMPIDSGIDAEAELSYNQQQHSSASETSKGSVLSLSRSESRVKARERARERVKEKDRDEAQIVSHHQNLDPRLNSQGSFTKLLTEGSISSSIAVTASSTANFIHNQLQNLPPVTSTMDYFRIQSSLLGQQQQQQQKTTTHQSSSSGFSLQSHFGNISPIGMMPLFTNAGDHPATEMQQFSFDHFFPVATSASSGGGGDYNLNFSISPSLAGFHRGTLQSNSTTPHHHHRHHQQHQFQFSHHHQVQAHRLSSALDGSGVPFFFGAPATTAPAASHSQNPYPLPPGFDGYKHLELNGKGKS